MSWPVNYKTPKRSCPIGSVQQTEVAKQAVVKPFCECNYLSIFMEWGLFGGSLQLIMALIRLWSSGEIDTTFIQMLVISVQVLLWYASAICYTWVTFSPPVMFLNYMRMEPHCTCYNKTDNFFWKSKIFQNRANLVLYNERLSWKPIFVSNLDDFLSFMDLNVFIVKIYSYMFNIQLYTYTVNVQLYFNNKIKYTNKHLFFHPLCLAV